MKLEIPYIPEAKDEIPEAAAHVKVGVNNWPDQFPYSPRAEAFLWHTGNRLHIVYRADEEHVAATVEADNGPVYTDSCMEFFIAFDNNGYYNIESNCIGKILMSHRRGRDLDIHYAAADTLGSIERTPSLGTAPFECKKAAGPWQLRLDIPASAFFKHSLASFKGVEARANIYKCGDKLPVPHFLSWNAITAEKPNFHLPEFFASIIFA